MAKYALLFIGQPPGTPTNLDTNAEWNKWIETQKNSYIYHSGTAFSQEGRSLSIGKLTELVPDADTVGGYVVIQADNFNVATDIAKTSPHAQWGGLTEVRLCRDL